MLRFSSLRRVRYNLPVSVRLVIGILALAGMSLSCVISLLVGLRMVDEVNAMLPRELQFGLMVWYMTKTLRLHREYKRLFPSGGLLLKYRLATGAAFVCLLVCAWAMGFFSLPAHLTKIH